MANVLVTGMSGTGKSTALDELGRRGFSVVDTDSTAWSEWIPAAGEWLWREDRIAELLASQEGDVLFVSGCMSNQGKFYDRFDAVVLLSAPLEVILERVANRTTNDYGKRPGELDLIRFHLETVEPLLRATCTHELDASLPLDDVVDALVAIGQSPKELTGTRSFLRRVRSCACACGRDASKASRTTATKLRNVGSGQCTLAAPSNQEGSTRKTTAVITTLPNQPMTRNSVASTMPQKPSSGRPTADAKSSTFQASQKITGPIRSTTRSAASATTSPPATRAPIPSRRKTRFTRESTRPILRHQNVDLAPARSSCMGKAATDRREGTTMKYLMLVCWDAEKMDAQTEPGPNDTPEEESFPWLDDLQARGRWITGDQLAPPRRARSVRVRDGKAIVSDGPFVETKEALGGFDIIECDSLEEAVEIAAGHPVAQMGTIEVRPFWGN